MNSFYKTIQLPIYGIASMLFVIFYPMLISIYVFLPLFIGTMGYLLMKGIEENRIFYILLPFLLSVLLIDGLYLISLLAYDFVFQTHTIVLDNILLYSLIVDLLVVVILLIVDLLVVVIL